jgi:two-component system response regulator FixJ
MLNGSDVVCIVEDDAAVRNALKFALEIEGLSVRTYDGPVSFLEEQDLPSLRCLIVDYRMPVMDGLELTAAVRERGMTGSVIMITGRASKGLREQAAKLGIRHLLEKPLSDSALIDAIREGVKVVDRRA